MTEWWNEQSAGLIGGLAGAGVGTVGGLFGALIGVCAPRGKLKGVTIPVHLAGLGMGVAAMGAAAAAALSGQPGHVQSPLIIVGTVLVVSLGLCYPSMLTAYRVAEARRGETEKITTGISLGVARALLLAWDAPGDVLRTTRMICAVLAALAVASACLLVYTHLWLSWGLATGMHGVAALLGWFVAARVRVMVGKLREQADRQRLEAEEFRRAM